MVGIEGSATVEYYYLTSLFLYPSPNIPLTFICIAQKKASQTPQTIYFLDQHQI